MPARRARRVHSRYRMFLCWRFFKNSIGCVVGLVWLGRDDRPSICRQVSLSGIVNRLRPLPVMLMYFRSELMWLHRRASICALRNPVLARNRTTSRSSGLQTASIARYSPSESILGLAGFSGSFLIFVTGQAMSYKESHLAKDLSAIKWMLAV